MSLASIRRTKIVATLGPAWESRDRMVALLDAGVDVVRVNASHGTPEVRARWIRDLKEVIEARSSHCSAAILL
ncbi:MAG TPA: pyruvate kinase, partial [Gemmatimonadales bacterium]|nr:pyruvate kinase [Gemmatimonadales bacterium]